MVAKGRRNFGQAEFAPQKVHYQPLRRFKSSGR
jgi:hypothetical protein